MTGSDDDTAQDRRLALIGHDIRSAIADIVGGLHLIDEAQLDPATLVQLERVRAASETVWRLVDEALQAGPEAGEAQMRAAPPWSDAPARLGLKAEAGETGADGSEAENRGRQWPERRGTAARETYGRAAQAGATALRIADGPDSKGSESSTFGPSTFGPSTFGPSTFGPSTFGPSTFGPTGPGTDRPASTVDIAGGCASGGRAPGGHSRDGAREVPVEARPAGAAAGRSGAANRPLGFALLDLLRDLERRWAGHAAGKGLGFRIVSGTDLPTRVAVEPLRLERILSNLLDNALKYAERGEITLTITCRNDGTLAFAVRDEGPGFSTASFQRLFDYRGRPAGSAEPGTGMGLHIAKGLADGLGGRLEARNARDDEGRGAGAEVVLRLPRAAWALPDARSGTDLPDLGGGHALVAEDNPTHQLVLTRMLDTLGLTHEVVADGAAAQQALARGGFDLAIVDVNLPGQSGLEAIAATRALPDARAHVPVLAATAYVLRTKREEIYAAGADGILAKPIVSLVAFAEAVAAILPRSATVAAPAPEAMGDEADPAPRLAHLAEIAGPDGRLELLERLDADLRCASEGLDAAQTARDPARIRSHSHVLISLTGAVGAERLQAAMEALNCAAHDGEWSAIDRILAAAATPLAALRCTISAQHARALAAEGVEGTAAPTEPQARPA